MLAAIMNAFGSALRYSGLVTTLYHMNASKARILMYHRIAEHTSMLPDALTVTPAVFEQQLAYLSKHYHVLPLSKLVKMIRTGEKFPRHSVALTFDDGFADNLTIAAPLLEKYGFTGTFYVVGQCLAQQPLWLHRWYALNAEAGPTRILPVLAKALQRQIRTIRHGVQVLKYECSRAKREEVLQMIQEHINTRFEKPTIPYLTYADVQTLKKHGHDIGYHTNTHAPLIGLTPAELHEELVTTKKTVERETGALRQFAYPFGEKHALGDAESLLQSNYDSAVTTIEGLVTPKDAVHRLRRLSVVNCSPAVFAATLEGARAFAVNMYQTISGGFL